MASPTSLPSPMRPGQPVELDGQVGQRLSDAVVQVAGDPVALLVRSDGADAGEPSGVVDRERHGLDEPGEQIDRSRVVVVGGGVFDGQQPDDLAPGLEGGVEPRGRTGVQPGSEGAEEVADRHDRSLGQCPPQRRRQLGRAEAGREPTSDRPGDLPLPVGFVEEQDRRGVDVHDGAQPGHRRVEGAVHVQRRRQRLGDAVERIEQGVGVGQAADPVEHHGLLAVGQAGDASGVRGHHGHEDHDQRPFRRQSEVLRRRAAAGRGRDGDDRAGDDGRRDRQPEPGGEPRDDHRGHEREDERTAPLIGGRHGGRW